MRGFGDEMAGFVRIDLSKNDSDTGFIRTICLNEAYRGKGHAAQLLGYAVSVFRSMGKRYIGINVSKTNEPAIRFYEKF